MEETENMNLKQIKYLNIWNQGYFLYVYTI